LQLLQLLLPLAREAMVVGEPVDAARASKWLPSTSGRGLCGSASMASE
jgi:hypothetical protein